MRDRLRSKLAERMFQKVVAVQVRHSHCLASGLGSVSSNSRLAKKSSAAFSQTFLSQLKVVLFGRAGVGSASE